MRAPSAAHSWAPSLTKRLPYEAFAGNRRSDKFLTRVRTVICRPGRPRRGKPGSNPTAATILTEVTMTRMVVTHGATLTISQPGIVRAVFIWVTPIITDGVDTEWVWDLVTGIPITMDRDFITKVMGYSSGYGGYGGYPGSVVIINNNNSNYNYGEAGRPAAYGKRATRSGMVTTPEESVNYRSRTNYTAVTGDRPTNTGGRVSSPSKTTQQTEYYNRSWRTSQQSQSSYPSRNSTNNTWSSPDRSSSFDNHSRSSSNSGSSFSSPSRSSSFDSGGGGATRSSAPASSGSNGSSRGAD